MSIALPSETVFHAIERTIKEYRKFAQRNISESFNEITIDQGMVLLYLEKYPDLALKEIAELVFKDNASMTRMINLMEEKKYLKRSINLQDRRRFNIEISSKGKEILSQLPSIIKNNRKQSLKGISIHEISQMETTLKKIITNCNKM
jgi:DNA-binding MarR family transcriptional regulator